MSVDRHTQGETAYLLDSSANAERLRVAIRDADGGPPGLILIGKECVAVAVDPANFLARHAGK